MQFELKQTEYRPVDQKLTYRGFTWGAPFSFIKDGHEYHAFNIQDKFETRTLVVAISGYTCKPFIIADLGDTEVFRSDFTLTFTEELWK